MPEAPPTTYSPVVQPRDPSSVPPGLGANDELHVPLPPRRDLELRTPPWVRRLLCRHRAIVSFCYSDRRLLHWERRPGEAEKRIRDLAPYASLTLDVPYYAFMAPAQKERALARSVAAIARGLRLWEPAGIRTIPLIKGLAQREWSPQLEAARDLGLSRVAFYAREALLERDPAILAAFLKETRRRGLRALLVGVFTPRPPHDGTYDAAASYHYVLARLGRVLGRGAEAKPLTAVFYSQLARRFLERDDVRGLNQHNFLQARRLFDPRAALQRFGFQWT